MGIRTRTETKLIWSMKDMRTYTCGDSLEVRNTSSCDNFHDEWWVFYDKQKISSCYYHEAEYAMKAAKDMPVVKQAMGA